MNDKGYLERRTSKNCYRNWWLVKASTVGYNGVINKLSVNLPKKYVGKRVMIKVEVIE